MKTFQPYDKTKEVNAEARTAGAALITEGAKAKGRKTFIYVNNRLEGNALSTIEAMVDGRSTRFLSHKHVLNTSEARTSLQHRAPSTTCSRARRSSSPLKLAAQLLTGDLLGDEAR